MSRVVVWAVFVLGVAHIVFGLLKFQAPLMAALMDGFTGQFGEPEIRRTAFWFVMAGPLIMLVGHLAIRAVSAGDFGALKVIGTYMLIFSAVGVAAFPASPLWASLVLSLLLIASGYRLI
ncbi:MAG TPA: DUF6463 family protein [Polaromonas sp.]|uniref:DUF6463 family protein n=1 Tax=Polaromonas sp. TaxID=1869339 RepID=UPI002D6CE811|nr:DUF6463 family protein [Polaromonas sp.]HYW56195.1 DUF6463 family protein [Polaromonas sp.]